MGSVATSPSQVHAQRAEPAIVPIGTPLRKKAQKLQVLEEGRKFRPILYWYLSFRCNLACAHCSVQSSPWVDTSGDLTTEECMRVIDQIDDMNVRAAILTGGEVLIRPDALQIMHALGDRGIQVVLETNGLRFDKDFVELARDLQSRNLLSMTISLDEGTRETHERLRGPRSFERTVRGLRFLKENGVHFLIQCVLNGDNYQTIPNLYTLAKELSPECTMVQWAVLNPIGRGVGLVKELGLRAQHIEPMFQLLRDAKQDYPGQSLIKMPPAMVPPKYLPMVFKEERTGCMTTCEFPLLGVLPNGNVSVCALSRENEELQFGNIREENLSLKDIWHKTRMEMLRSRYTAAEDLQGICGDCVWKHTCKGACRAWAYEEGDSFDSPFPICQALDEAGVFPKLYRLSLQNAAVARKFQAMSAGCGCTG